MKIERIIRCVGNGATNLGLRPGCSSYSLSEARRSTSKKTFSTARWSSAHRAVDHAVGQMSPGKYFNKPKSKQQSNRDDENFHIEAGDSPPIDDSLFFDNLECLKDVKIKNKSVVDAILNMVDVNEMNQLLNMEKGIIDQDPQGSLLPSATNEFKNVAYLWACFRGLVDLLPKLEECGADSRYAIPVTGITAIQASSLSNNVACVQYLLNHGIDCNARNTSNHYTPLHFATFGNAYDTAKLLLDRGAKLENHLYNVEPPLHCAIRARAVKTVALLLERGASVSLRNHAGETALHVACFVQSIPCVDLLVNVLQTDVNALGRDRRTPLHFAVMSTNSSKKLIEPLLIRGADVNAVDKDGYTPLHIAALNELSECVDTLIRAGADLSAETRAGVTAFGIIHRKMPESLDVFRQRLDSSLRLRRPASSCNREFELRLDFEALFPASNKCETGLVNIFLEQHRKDLLLHPLVTAFLYLKWYKIRKFYWGRIMFYFITVACLTAYVMTAMTHRRCSDYPRTVNGTGTILCTDLYLIGMLPWQSVIDAEWYLLLFLICFTVPRKLMAFVVYQSFKQYVSYGDNVLDLFVIIGVFIISFADTGKSYDWHNFVGAFAVLCAWTNLMLLVGQLPAFGTYVAMFTQVQWEFAKLLLAYSGVLIGFTVSFCVIFSGTPSFANPLIGLIKVLSMMVGDLDFEGLMHPEQSGYPVTYAVSVCSQILFTLFLVFVTVILMNLLVGIAVDDIQGLRRHAGLTKLVRQTKLIIFVETALHNNLVPRYIREWILDSHSRFGAFEQKRVLVLKPFNPLEKRLPKDLVREAYEIASKNSPMDFDDDRSNSKTDWIYDNDEGKSSSPNIVIDELTARLKVCEDEVRMMKDEFQRSNQMLQEVLSKLKNK